jgi:sugar fermentation stimulation protein A
MAICGIIARMNYDNIHEGIFINRPNRFIANVQMDGITEKCHVKNTGRCLELLIAGAKVYLVASENPRRSTKYDLVSVLKGDRLVNMDSQAPNKAWGEYLSCGKFMPDTTVIKAETTFGNSRFDFYAESAIERAFMEVKGVTLEQDNVVLFPDAPTERGLKHVNELCECQIQGYSAYVIFVIQMTDVRYFKPNDKTQPEFGKALLRAVELGVKVLAYDCEVRLMGMDIRREVPVVLNE